MRYPVITIKQPWASWIVLGYKTIETRTHARFASLKGKTILLHAGLSFDEYAIPNEYLELELEVDPTKIDYPRGKIIGSAFVQDFRKLSRADNLSALIDCHNAERYGLVLTNIQMFAIPIPVAGKLGVWYHDFLKD